MIPLVKAKLVGLAGKVSGAIEKIRIPILAKGGAIVGAGYLGARGITEAGKVIRTAGEQTREIVRDAGRDIRGFGAFFWILIAIVSIVGVFLLIKPSVKRIAVKRVGRVYRRRRR